MKIVLMNEMTEPTLQLITKILAEELDVSENELIDKLLQDGRQHYKGDSYWEEDFFAECYTEGSILGFCRMLCEFDDESLFIKYGLNAEEIKLLREGLKDIEKEETED